MFSIAPFNRSTASLCLVSDIATAIFEFLVSVMGIPIANCKNRCDVGALSVKTKKTVEETGLVEMGVLLLGSRSTVARPHHPKQGADSQISREPVYKLSPFW